MLYRCITNIERIFDKKKRQTASFSNIFGKISDFMCQTPGILVVFRLSRLSLKAGKYIAGNN